MKRREFLVAAGGLGAVISARVLAAQQQGATGSAQPMDQSAYRATYRPAKPGAGPSMTDLERDELEKKLKCQCTCTLDVYTCRTTDFTCPVSPAMHADVIRLVDGGHSADEIIAAFVETYGEVAMTSPKKEGFNWVGYFAPAAALATGGVVLTMMLRRWSLASAANAELNAAVRTAAGPGAAADAAPPASADELARLERALREED